MRSPKQAASSRSPSHRPQDWYRYYAGYSSDFVEDILSALNLGGSHTVCDPWNGAGTTTEVAFKRGIKALGYDINPAMVIVSKARLLRGAIHPSEGALAEHLLEISAQTAVEPLEDDPLLTWFTRASAKRIRALEKSIYHCLVDARLYRPLSEHTGLGQVSNLAAFFYVGLFQTVRSLLAPFQSSNPTWIRRRIQPADRRWVSADTLARRFRCCVTRMIPQGLTDVQICQLGSSDRDIVRLEVSPSNALPQPKASIDAIVTSPPYCTRIDYAVATAPELAVLGYTRASFRSLREQCIGTSVVRTEKEEPNDRWGKTCNDFLRKVRNHPSKASEGYYLSTHLQYFEDLFSSLEEITRIVRPGGDCVMVVQDSHYKNVHNDLPAVAVEMAEELGWKTVSKHAFPASHLMARVNPGAREYRAKPTATEMVLHFSKPIARSRA